jgi:hypothetical protein
VAILENKAALSLSDFKEPAASIKFYNPKNLKSAETLSNSFSTILRIK